MSWLSGSGSVCIIKLHQELAPIFDEDVLLRLLRKRNKFVHQHLVSLHGITSPLDIEKERKKLESDFDAVLKWKRAYLGGMQFLVRSYDEAKKQFDPLAQEVEQELHRNELLFLEKVKMRKS